MLHLSIVMQGNDVPNIQSGYVIGSWADRWCLENVDRVMM